jgi:L-ascorbate metabolism protein UlaG (beta-lactamase superfamily)
MARLLIVLVTSLLMITMAVPMQAAAGTDVLKTSGGDLEITPLGHASVMFKYRGKVIQVDPFGKMANYSKLPKADLVLITHEHHDHFDPSALKKTMKKNTVVIATKAIAEKLRPVTIMRNGDVKTVDGLKIEAVPAYNIVHKRDTGQPFHPKGRGNGYVITFGDKRVYVAFLPANLPYTMDAAMVVDAVKGFKPKILYPYHYALGKSQLPGLKKLMKGVQGTQFRVPN